MNMTVEVSDSVNDRTVRRFALLGQIALFVAAGFKLFHGFVSVLLGFGGHAVEDTRDFWNPSYYYHLDFLDNDFTNRGIPDSDIVLNMFSAVGEVLVLVGLALAIGAISRGLLERS